MGNSCQSGGLLTIEHDIEDEDGDKVGTLNGAIITDKHTLNEWMVRNGILIKVITTVSRTTQMLPVAVINKLYVNVERRRMGFGRDAINYFFDCAIEEDARTSLVIVDTNEAQTKGFKSVEWLERHGYRKLGLTDKAEIVMFRRFPNK